MPEQQWTTPLTFEDFFFRYPDYIRRYAVQRNVPPELCDRFEGDAIAYLTSAPRVPSVYPERYQDGLSRRMAICPDFTVGHFFMWVCERLQWCWLTFEREAL